MPKKLFFVALALTLLGAGCDSTGAPPPVSLIKASGPAVYYFADGKRYAYPNEAVFTSWDESFSDVQDVTDATLSSIPLAGLVTYQAGTLIKIQTDPKVYVVDRLNIIRWVSSEDIAISLFGEDWATQVHDVDDTLFAGYKIGAPILSESDYDRLNKVSATYRNYLYDSRDASQTDASKAFPRMGSFTNVASTRFYYTASSTASEAEIWSWAGSVMSGWTQQYEFNLSETTSTTVARSYMKTVGTTAMQRVVTIVTDTGSSVKKVYFYELPFPDGFLVYPRSATNEYSMLDTDAQQLFVTADSEDTVMGWYQTNAEAQGWSQTETGEQSQISRYAVYENPSLQRRMTVAFIEPVSATGTNAFVTTYTVSLPE